MSKLVPGLILAFATVFSLPAVSAVKSVHKESVAATEKTAKTEAAVPMDKDTQQKLKEHLRMRNHIVKDVKYPATKETLVSTFKGMKDVKAGDKKWFEETLTAGTYESPDDVMKALGWEVSPVAPTTSAKSGN